MSALSLDNPVFLNFLFYSAIVLAKTVLMSAWTSSWRLRSTTFSTPEDYVGMPRKPESAEAKDAIKRIRSCHRNDMENVYPFILIGLLYVCTKPDPHTALMVFRIFAAARIIHTIAYTYAIRQPCRVLAFATGLMINLYMIMKLIMHGAS